MTIQASAARRKAMADTITAASSSGKLRIYSGARPADTDAGIGAAVLLAELTMHATAFDAPAAVASAPYVLTAGAITADVAADASGTPSWFRIWQSDGTTPVIDGSVGTSGTDLVINASPIVAGAAISALSLTLTLVA